MSYLNLNNYHQILPDTLQTTDQHMQQRTNHLTVETASP